uniref:Uncharacterized protein n=1 Tax=Peronospora matthiolae TaxID=2874970 RepID=A0AAV1V1C9_9STRA
MFASTLSKKGAPLHSIREIFKTEETGNEGARDERTRSTPALST